MRYAAAAILCILLVVWFQIARTDTLPKKIQVSPSLAVAVKSAKVDQENGYTMLRMHCEWMGGDPNRDYVITRPKLAGNYGNGFDPSFTWYVGFGPGTQSADGGIPFDLEIKNPPDGLEHYPIAFSLIAKTSKVESHEIHFELPVALAPKTGKPNTGW